MKVKKYWLAQLKISKYYLSVAYSLFKINLLRYHSLCIWGLCILTWSCSDGYKNIEDFYFPLEEMYDGLTYEYRSTLDTALAPYYWYFRTMDQENATYLTGMYYDYAFTPTQFVREEKVSNGMLLEQLFIYQTDTSGLQVQVPTQVDDTQNSVYPFQVKDELGVFLYHITWESPLDATTYTIIRNRRYLKDTTYTYYGKPIPAVLFEVKEVIESRKEGVLEIENRGREIYAQGLGLVYTSKTSLDGNFRQAFALHDRYPMEELERKFGASLQ